MPATKEKPVERELTQREKDQAEYSLFDMGQHPLQLRVKELEAEAKAIPASEYERYRTVTQNLNDAKGWVSRRRNELHQALVQSTPAAAKERVQTAKHKRATILADKQRAQKAVAELESKGESGVAYYERRVEQDRTIHAERKAQRNNKSISGADADFRRAEEQLMYAERNLKARKDELEKAQAVLADIPRRTAEAEQEYEDAREAQLFA